MKRIMTAAAAALLLALGAASGARAQDVDLSKYLQTGASAAAVASAIAQVTPCDEPLQFHEMEVEYGVRLMITCASSESGAGIDFMPVPGGNTLLPQRFSYAG